MGDGGYWAASEGYAAGPLRPTVHHPDKPVETYDEIESLGVSLGPALRDHCGDKLGRIEWFRSAWQRSGAATGRTFWRLPSGEVIDAVVKVPVGYREYYWTSHIGATDPMMWAADEARGLPVPRVLAAGTELGGYDMAWLVLERLPGKTIGSALSVESLGRLFHSAARFYRLADETRAPQPGDRPTPPAWGRLLERARASVVDNGIPNEERWVRQIDRVTDGLDAWVAEWDARPIDTWCHGDLHPGNVMLRPDADSHHEPCAVLLDLGLMHAGCWIEDAVYLERQHWGREDELCGVDPMESLAAARREEGLPVDEVCWRLADVRRTLMAATSPAFLEAEGGRRYLAAALSVLERLEK